MTAPTIDDDLRARPPGAPARVVRVPLDCRLSPAAAVRRLAGLPGAFALTGRWAGGGVLLGSHPVRVVEGEVFDALDCQPAVANLAEAQAAGAVAGGWFGYLGYQLSRAVEAVPPPRSRPVPLPDGRLAFHDHLVRRTDGRWWFEALWTDERADDLRHALDDWAERLAGPEPPVGPCAFESFEVAPHAAEHEAAIERALEHIAAGDVFQINLTLQLRAAYHGDPLDAFARGLDALHPPFGAYLALERGAVASFSPELFLRREGRHVLTSPIKGTISRPGDSAGARQSRDALVASAKNRAENVMIVDLMRNDLGRVCEYGSIAVPALHRAEAHPGLWHLVSDVTGRLRRGVGDADLLRATFPPGSCTGAPKVRAMQLINELESVGREAYTGAVGFASPVAGLETSVAIRTFEFCDGQAWLGAGGGIVADSRPDDEFRECLVKAKPLLDGIYPGGV